MGASESAVGRAKRVLQSEGPGAILGRVRSRVQSSVFLDEEHVWYELELNGDRPRRELPDDVTLVRADYDDIPLIEELDELPGEAIQRKDAGNDLWLARDEKQLLFLCWTFRKRTPVLAAPGGWLELPPRVACLEDSVTSPAARGRGIAPGSWTAIADALGGEEFDTMITKVTTDNAPSRKAVTKAGFREVGIMRLRKRGPRSQTTMDPEGDGLGAELARRVTGAA